jgi:hypothetical protein
MKDFLVVNDVLKEAISQIKSLYPSAAFHQKAKEGNSLHWDNQTEAIIRWRAYPERSKYETIFVGLEGGKLYVYWDFGYLGDHRTCTTQTIKSDQAVIDAVMGLAALTKQKEEKDAEFRKSMEDVLEAANK